MERKLATIKNKIFQAKWLPLTLAVLLVFIPNSLLIFKLLGVVLALFLFYHSILLDRESSKRSLMK